jgi:rSAM/selenodomain-associated transferase 1
MTTTLPSNAAGRLIVFTRYPEPGRAKTRLIPALGAAGAADLHRRMTARMLALADALGDDAGIHLEVRFCGCDATAMKMLYGERFSYAEQGEGDLGARLHRAAADAFAAGCRRVVIIGTDCPDLSPQILRDGFDRLATHDLALGPAADGGYYLIGLARHAPTLLLTTNINWGSPDVLRQTRDIARAEGLSVAMLEELADVDVPGDLPACRRAGLL